MNILVVEDDKTKCEQVARHVQATCGDNGIAAQIITKTSYQSGLRECVKAKPDILILDMTMPTYDVAVDEPGGRPRHFAGRDILRELQRRMIVIPTVVVTGFDVIGEGSEQCTRAELTAQLHGSFPESFRGTVFYTTSESGWKSQLTELLNQLL